MRFGDILGKTKILNTAFLNEEVVGLSQESKTISNGEIFFNLCEDYENSLKYSKEALERGAKFVVSQIKLPIEKLCLASDIRECFGECCCNFYDNPSKKLKIIGITGTNGKTTCAHVISEILRFAGKKVATIGTMGIEFDGQTEDYSMTTPDVDVLQKSFSQMQKSGVEYVVMEVSAHAIAQKRIHGITFDVGVLTNITQDHLDYFGSMENYKNCKLSLFVPKTMKSAVICADDESGRELLRRITLPTISYGLENPADVFAVNINGDFSHTDFYCNVLDEIYNVNTNLIGGYNVLNTLAGLSVCVNLGIDLEKAVESLRYINPVEGRFNVIKFKDKNIVIDFAHTPDGLEKVLSVAKELCMGNLYCVFGCGGNRDKDKRHKMGTIAEKYCDYVCLTDDNPRFENSLDIIKDIEKGMKKSHFVEPDRKLAIEKMVNYAKKDDVLVIAGKGGEKYQIVGDKKLDYNDFDVIYKIIKNETEKSIKEKYGN